MVGEEGRVTIEEGLREGMRRAGESLEARLATGPTPGVEAEEIPVSVMEAAFTEAAQKRPDIREKVAAARKDLDEEASAAAVPSTEEAQADRLVAQQKEIEELEKALAEERQAREQEAAARKRAERENNKLRKTIEDQRRQIETLQAQATVQEEVISQLRAEVEEVKEKTLPELQVQITRLNLEIEQLKPKPKSKRRRTAAPPEPPPAPALEPPPAAAPEAPVAEPLAAEAPVAPEAEPVPAEPETAPPVPERPRQSFWQAIREQWSGLFRGRRAPAAAPAGEGQEPSVEPLPERLAWARDWQEGVRVNYARVGQLTKALAAGEITWTQLPQELRRYLVEYRKRNGKVWVTADMLRDWGTRAGEQGKIARLIHERLSNQRITDWLKNNFLPKEKRADHLAVFAAGAVAGTTATVVINHLIPPVPIARTALRGVAIGFMISLGTKGVELVAKKAYTNRTEDWRRQLVQAQGEQKAEEVVRLQGLLEKAEADHKGRVASLAASLGNGFKAGGIAGAVVSLTGVGELVLEGLGVGGEATEAVSQAVSQVVAGPDEIAHGWVEQFTPSQAVAEAATETVGEAQEAAATVAEKAQALSEVPRAGEVAAQVDKVGETLQELGTTIEIEEPGDNFYEAAVRAFDEKGLGFVGPDGNTASESATMALLGAWKRVGLDEKLLSQVSAGQEFKVVEMLVKIAGQGEKGKQAADLVQAYLNAKNAADITRASVAFHAAGF